MGDRWGMEGPPEEAYSRVTNPERFQSLHDAAIELLDRLEREFAVKRFVGCVSDAEMEKASNARPAVRLVPDDPESAPIAVAFTDFPGLSIKFGHWCRKWLPICGCDACDETADEVIEEMTWLVDSVVSGGFREVVRISRLAGDGRHVTEFRNGGRRSSSYGNVERSRALEMTGGESNVTLNWKPWPPRNPPLRYNASVEAKPWESST